MNFFKALFGGSEETPEQKQQADETRKFDMFKYDGVKAAKMGQHDYAVKCYKEALKIREDLEVRDYLAQSLIRTGQLAEAYEQLETLAAGRTRKYSHIHTDGAGGAHDGKLYGHGASLRTGPAH